MLCRTPVGHLLFGGGGNPAYDYRFGGAATIDVDAGDAGTRFMRRAMLRYCPALAGTPIADRYDGIYEARRDLPFYQKRLLPMPPGPLRWLGYQAFTRATGRPPRR
jgi:hypothetical protein